MSVGSLSQNRKSVLFKKLESSTERTTKTVRWILKKWNPQDTRSIRTTRELKTKKLLVRKIGKEYLILGKNRNGGDK